MMNRKPTPLEKRVAATQFLLDEWKGRPFSWRDQMTCARLCAAHLRRMGHKPGISRGGSYTSALGARRALARAGFASLSEWLDDVGLGRIPPAAAIVGDILELPAKRRSTP